MNVGENTIKAWIREFSRSRGRGRASQGRRRARWRCAPADRVPRYSLTRRISTHIFVDRRSGRRHPPPMAEREALLKPQATGGSAEGCVLADLAFAQATTSLLVELVQDGVRARLVLAELHGVPRVRERDGIKVWLGAARLRPEPF